MCTYIVVNTKGLVQGVTPRSISLIVSTDLNDDACFECHEAGKQALHFYGTFCFTKYGLLHKQSNQRDKKEKHSGN